MKIKTSELTGAALDWSVAKCEGTLKYYVQPNEKRGTLKWELTPHVRRYSTNWAQGGPIVDNIKGLQFKHWLGSKPETCCEAHINNYEGDWVQFGPTTLIAALRCYVDSELGDEVDIPKELT